MRGDFSDFRQRLLEWFDQLKRPLPWRTDAGLYATVVSEFMLQQTQVDTVIPYFERWMQAFPDFKSLAQAEETAVLKLWEGLGYYSRARNLLKLARSILAEGVPTSAEEWRQRPGIGPYTAAAIASIAQGECEPVIDGNVIRVLSRIANDASPVKSTTQAHRRFLPLARDLIDRDRPGDFNEAVMELGATICRKARPACRLCPVNVHCRAFEAGTAESLPVIPRKAATRREIHRLLCIDDHRLLLFFHPPDAPRLAGLAELPELKSPPASPPRLSRSRGISSEHIREFIHQLAPDHTLVLQCLSLQNVRWIPLDELPSVSLSGPHRRWIQELLASPSDSR